MSKRIYCSVGCKYASQIKKDGCPTPRLCCHFCKNQCPASSCEERWEECENRLTKEEAVAYLLTEGLKSER